MATQVPAPRSSLRDFSRLVAAWGLLVGLTVGAFGLVVDAVSVAIRGPADAAWLASGIAAWALGALLGLLLSPLFAALHAISRALVRRRLPRGLHLLPIALAAFVGGSRMTHSFAGAEDLPRHVYAFELIVLGFVAATLTMTWLWLRAAARWARAAAFGIALAAFVYDVVTPRGFYRDSRDLAAMITAAGLLVVARPAFTWLYGARASRLWAAAGALLAVALTIVMTIEPVHPGWRGSARFGRYMPRFARAFRLLVDFDGDGFSPIAWGGDCDDFDPKRNPNQHESAPGVDTNCNGIALPESPTDADRGLAPPLGDPDLAPESIDHFLLVTIDCWRVDTLRPDVMPHLHRFAARGLTLTRLYAAGSQTVQSLPLMQRGFDHGQPVATRLAGHGVTSTAIIAFHLSPEPDLTPGFDAVHSGSAIRRWSASEMTDRALGVLRETDAAPHYLWIHYSDAHIPYPPIPADVPVPRVAYPEPAYLARLAYVNREIGRLLDALEAEGRLGRTAIVLTADHGEGLGAHGVQYHGTTTYEPIIHVPGILWAPGVVPGSYDGLASHRDIPATILGAFGAVAGEGDGEVFGRSWLRLRAEPRPEIHRFVVTRSYRTMTLYQGYTSPLAAIVEGRLKLTKAFEDGLRVMYDVTTDPGEDHDLEPKLRAEASALEHDLELYRDLDAYP